MSIVTNQQLFSHTYLAQLQADPSPDDAAAPIAQGLRDWLPYRDTSSLSSLIETWVGPVLDFLEFHHAPADDAPHVHLLYAHRGDETPAGLCFLVPPGQDLDGTIKGRHPMAQAVLALRARSLRWGILTDGARWRLVDAQSLRRYEHYVEVDLDRLAHTDDPTPLRLFYTLFHRSAFSPSSPSPCEGEGRVGVVPSQGEDRVGVELDERLAASERATRRTEDHLKTQVSHNEGIMAQLCLGLVRAGGAAHGATRYTEAERDAIYRDATYLLYRVLFILYAEARGLLPVEQPAYRAVSLAALVQTARDYKLRGMPDPQATTLWERLRRLCHAIYSSDPELGIPAYDGGLFDDADKPYLRQGHVADAYLTEALFDLAYMLDDDEVPGTSCRPIDYRDLSVRHLGSLYEGMIEYRLQIAEETLWARRDRKGNLRFLRTGQDGAPRKTDEEIEPGSVYFSQSPGERRATGTYYTPEYIVDYIVRQTVVRGLEERRAALEEKLCGWLEEIAATSDPGERARMQRAADEELVRFVEEQVLTFRVCDPGMGSGHFLVNAAHQITNFIVETLHLAPWENDRVDADPVAWRRRVVEHCLYGVDLSLMAVELGKLSLWLASVAQGKPLSFLDHHLRQGNSLIGARLEDLAEMLAGAVSTKPSRKERKAREAGQLSMLDDPAFSQHVTAATGLLARISARVAETVEDVKAQEADYEQVRTELEPYRRLADLWTARHFGVKVNERELRAVARYLVNGAVGPVPEYQRFMAGVQESADARHFFHWELEFPEVFLDQHDGSLQGKAGFNALVGNPPYVRQERLSDQKGFFQAAFNEVYKGIADLYVYFVTQGIKNLADGGLLGLITANKWLRADYAAPLRSYLTEHATPVQLLDFGHSNVFPGTDTFPCILIVTSHSEHYPSNGKLLFADVSDRARGSVPLPDHVREQGFEIPFSNLWRTGWILEPAGVSHLLKKLQMEFPKLGEQAGIDALFGIKTGLNAAYFVDTPTRSQLVERDPGCEPLLRKLLRGRTIKRWCPAWEGEWIIFLPSSSNRIWPWSSCEDHREAEGIFRQTYPSLYDHLKSFENRLRHRRDQGQFWWELRSCAYYETLEKPKIVVQQILYHSVFALDVQSHLVNEKVYSLTTDDLYLLGLLNSRVMWWYLYRMWPHMKDEALGVQKRKLLSLPIPEVSADLRSQIETLVQQACQIAGKEKELPDLLHIESQINDCVLEAYGLTGAQAAIIERTLPPRDPLVVLEKRMRKVRQSASV